MSSEQPTASQAPRGFYQDLENARVLIEDSPWKDNPQKYRKVAEGILRRILTLDPENEPAKLMLAKAEAPPPPRVEVQLPWPKAEVQPPPLKVQFQPPPVKAEPAVAAVKPEAPLHLVKPAHAPETAAPRAAADSDLSFIVQPQTPKKQEPSRPSAFLLGLAVIGALAGLVLLVTHRDEVKPRYPVKLPVISSPVVPVSAATNGPGPVSAATNGPGPVSAAANSPGPVSAATNSPGPVASPQPIASPPPVPPSATPNPAPKASPKLQAAAAPPPVVVKSSVQPVAPIETGTLAVSSPTTVDIYMGQQLVGSAPTTLVLPVGNQTLEYRHQDKRKVLSHVIRANETTTTMVTFEIPVQINARPWAQVFIDGTQRQPLGQTPLSDVRVPIGSVLIFENPNFPGKTYRVTGSETEIRVTFP